MQITQVAPLLIGEHQGTHGLDGIELSLDALEQSAATHRILVSALTSLRRPLERPFDTRQVGKRELRVDSLDIRQRIDLAGDMYDVGALEAAHDVCNRIDIANVRQE